MAVHVYLQDQDKTTKQVYPRFRYRGETGPNDDPQSFKKTMGARGLKAHFTGNFEGLVVDEAKATELGWL